MEKGRFKKMAKKLFDFRNKIPKSFLVQEMHFKANEGGGGKLSLTFTRNGVKSCWFIETNTKFGWSVLLTNEKGNDLKKLVLSLLRGNLSHSMESILDKEDYFKTNDFSLSYKKSFLFCFGKNSKVKEGIARFLKNPSGFC